MVEDTHATVSQRGKDERVGSSATLAAGVRVGKYEILAVLGQGGFGVTYRARDTQLGREVAVKEYLPTSFAVRDHDGTVLPRSTQAAEDFRWGRQRFLDEGKTLAVLEEAPGIVNVYDFLEANGTAYMVMALVRGETLEARLRRDRTLPPQAIDQLLHPLLTGLQRIHDAGFLHRDIKPANILVDRDGQPTLIDFGASRAALQGRTQTLTAVYTPGYAAFEQFTSARQGPYTDIYALGATLYHCVTGNQPPSAIERAMRDKIIPAAEAGKGRYPPRLLAGIDAALKVDEEERPQTVGAWRRVLPDTPGAVTIPIRRRWPLRLAAAVLVLCMVVGGYVWWQGQQEHQAWVRATRAQTDAGYREYLTAYPTGRYVNEARRAIADLEAQRRDAVRAADEQAWSRAKTAHTVPAYRAYLAAHPAGHFVAEANKGITDLEADAQAWASATQAHTKESYREYLRIWPAGVRAAEAQRAIEELETREIAAARREEDEAWARARDAGTIPALRAYLQRYPSGRHAAQARILIADVERAQREADTRRAEDEAWAAAKAANTPAELQAFVDKYPLGRYAAEARATMAALAAEDQAWEEAKARNTTASMQAYLDRYPSGRHAANARATLSLLRRVEPTAAAKDREPQSRDCPQCPEMIRILPGSFTMGAAPGEHAREGVPADLAKPEQPQHRVTIGYAFSLGKYEVTRGEFAAFVQATGRPKAPWCYFLTANKQWVELRGKNWSDPGFTQTDNHPVACVNWDDAKAYADWLSQMTGKKYRLPSEAEWEYAARAGTTTARYWGSRYQDACQYANVEDATHGCRDGAARTALVGTFQPNALGLHDMLGNVWEWTEDCWNSSYAGAPTDGSAWQGGDCSSRALRGGSWHDDPAHSRTASRIPGKHRAGNLGFRVARTD